MYIELVNLVISSYLLGLILTIQVVHYPSFSFVDQKIFTSFHNFHTKKISKIVMIPMVIELVVSTIQLYNKPNIVNLILFALVVLIWISTALLSIPLHNQLSKAKSLDNIKKLVNTNWPRSFLWGTRVALLIYIINTGF